MMWRYELEMAGLARQDPRRAFEPADLRAPPDRRCRAARGRKAIRRRKPANSFVCDESGRRMTDLTSLTLAKPATGCASGILRGRTRRRASRRDREARALNAYVLETPERARAMAKARDARLAKGEARPARRHSARRQGPVLHRGRAHHRLLAHPRQFRADLRVDRHRQSLARRRGDARQDQHRRVRHGLVERDRRFRAGDHRRGGAQGVNAPLVPGGSSGGSAAAVAAQLCARRDRHRHRRLDPPAGGVHRHRRHQADLWPLLALGHRRLRLLARPGRAVRAHRARLRDPAALDGGHDPKDSTCVDVAGAGLRSGAVGESVKGMRIGIPKEYRIDGMPAEIETLCGSRASHGCKRRRRRDRRDLAAAHQIRAAGLLHRRAGRGLVQSRALRRRALRPARRRRATSSTCTSRRAPPASARRCAGAS